MAHRGLPPQEIKKRLIRLRNLEYLHEQQRFKIWHLRDENRALKKEVVALKAMMGEQQKTIDGLKLQIEELRTMVFGRKRKKEENDFDDTPPAPRERAPRAPDSYKRPLPNERAVTDTKTHAIDACTLCQGRFSERDTVTYFEEDIPLPQKKRIIKHTIEKGYCESCKRWSAGAPLPPARVILGENVKRYVSYLSVVCRQSYSQIRDVLKQTYDFALSQGEIAKILEKEGNRLRPAYERLKAKIRGEPSVHLDETGWNLVLGDGYRRFAWTMVGGASSDAAFVLGKTRGKGNATDLLGDSKATVVSDDYAAYRNLDNGHQLCAAHILRKLRDLAHSGEIAGEQHHHCIEAYKTFATIYANIETARASADPAASHGALLERMRTFAAPHSLDPAKLARIKTQVRERTENYLTCLLRPCVASDNNAAERSLRHLVLKRKISFGSFSEKTAETLSILLSVLMSFKRRGTLRNYLMGV